MIDRARIARAAVAAAGISAALGLWLGLASCNIVAPAAYIVGGQGKVDAEYTLENRPTVVFIDDRNNTLSPITLRQVIADRLTEDIMQNCGVSQALDPTDAMAVARRQDTYKTVMPIEEIGRSIGAEQVIYVELVAFVDSPDGYTPRPTSVVSVKVIDVVNRQRLYPATSDEEQAMQRTVARTVQTVLPPVDPESMRTRSERLKVHQLLAAETGSEIAKLFYQHVPRPLGESLQAR